MKDFIDSIGIDNIYIVVIIIAILMLALTIVIILEKKYNKKYEDLDDDYFFDEEASNFDSNDVFESSLPPEPKDYVESNEKDEKVIEDEKEQAKLEAKKAIEEAAKKMVYEDKKSDGPTYFEKMQEESSIISYDELKSSNINVDETNDKLLIDEGNEPITMEELFKDHIKKTIPEDSYDKIYENDKVVLYDESIKSTKKADLPAEKRDYINAIEKMGVVEGDIVKVTLPSDKKKPYSDDKTFKKSEVISPVYGVKKEFLFKKEYNDFGETIDIRELETEIRKTEEFLKELKKLKERLK